jgi:hypothetical protein
MVLAGKLGRRWNGQAKPERQELSHPQSPRREHLDLAARTLRELLHLGGGVAWQPVDPPGAAQDPVQLNPQLVR